MPLKVINFPDFSLQRNMWSSLNAPEMTWLHIIMETIIFYHSKSSVFSHFNFFETGMHLKIAGASQLDCHYFFVP